MTHISSPTFRYVEDYLEFIGGHRTADGKLLGLFNTVPTPISLARYDVNIVSSLSSQTAEQNKSYTDKQSALALKLVDKYRKQLAALPNPVYVPERVDDLQYRLGIRQIDRTKSITIENNKLLVRFPYDNKLIDLVRKQNKDGDAASDFDQDRKVWVMGLTENMLNWAVTVGKVHDFSISDEVFDLYEKMLKVEAQGYAIELDIEGFDVVLRNAPASLLAYINEKVGGLSIDNLMALTDYAPVLGYTLSPDLRQSMARQYEGNLWKLIKDRRINFKNVGESPMGDVLDYARKLNRLPVYVYEQGLPKKNTDEIIYLNRGIGPDVAPKLLVTTTSLMIGSKKQSWVTNAEKIVIIE